MYVIILPAFGVISQLIVRTTQKNVFCGSTMIIAMACISILGTLVWVHHMMTVGLDGDTRAYFTAVTILISIPTGTKVFNWLNTSMCKQISQSTLIFLFVFTVGGMTGVMLGNGSIDVAIHDTYYVVAHFHFVLSIAAATALISTVEEYFSSKTSSMSIGSPLFILFLLGIFGPMHILGFNVSPRRITDTADALIYLNSIITLNLVAGLIIPIIYIL